jgi:hypothetical protein
MSLSKSPDALLLLDLAVTEHSKLSRKLYHSLLKERISLTRVDSKRVTDQLTGHCYSNYKGTVRPQTMTLGGSLLQAAPGH